MNFLTLKVIIALNNRILLSIFTNARPGFSSIIYRDQTKLLAVQEVNITIGTIKQLYSFFRLYLAQGAELPFRQNYTM